MVGFHGVSDVVRFVEACDMHAGFIAFEQGFVLVCGYGQAVMDGAYRRADPACFLSDLNPLVESHDVSCIQSRPV